MCLHPQPPLSRKRIEGIVLCSTSSSHWCQKWVVNITFPWFYLWVLLDKMYAETRKIFACWNEHCLSVIWVLNVETPMCLLAVCCACLPIAWLRFTVSEKWITEYFFCEFRGLTLCPTPWRKTVSDVVNFTLPVKKCPIFYYHIHNSTTEPDKYRPRSLALCI
jgi:hypothetical protein